MTVLEALSEITKEKKWYITEDDQTGSKNRCAALRILNGTAKTTALQNFFSKFGYEYLIKEEVNKR